MAHEGYSRVGRACQSCHARKVKCDLQSRGTPPCSRCQDDRLPCTWLNRRKRAIRAINPVIAPAIEKPNHQLSQPPTPGSIENVCQLFSSLGIGDEPRKVDVTGVHDISKQNSILVEFLSQDFNDESIQNYQVTFVDDYTSITRLLGGEFASGFEKDVYHYRDAPLIERDYGGIPRAINSVERSNLDYHGSFMLPSSEIADTFVAAFFDRVHPTMPIVDRFQFTKQYHSMTATYMNVSLLLVQSIILSGSTAFQHPSLSLPPDEVSWRLHARAKALVDNRFEQDRLALVQAHLLFSTFVSDSCDDTIQNMWLSIGAAIRIAQGLGMHRNLGKARASDTMRRQWKRIWWTLFVHDTLCSFEWGRPRAIHLGDCDVPPLTESDFQPDEPGSLPSSEHVQLFINLCRLCLIISEWLDLRRPRTTFNSNVTISAETTIVELKAWHERLPWTMQAPSAGTRFTLWSGTLHIVYYALHFRLATSLPPSRSVAAMHSAAVNISSICKDLDDQDLLGSLWNFAIHEFDLAMGQHARETNGKDVRIAASGLRALREGLPMMRKLGRRSSVARQGLLFYEELVKKRSSNLEEAGLREQAMEDRMLGVNTSRQRSAMPQNPTIDVVEGYDPTNEFSWDPQFALEAMEDPLFAVESGTWSWDREYDGFDVNGQL